MGGEGVGDGSCEEVLLGTQKGVCWDGSDDVEPKASPPTWVYHLRLNFQSVIRTYERSSSNIWFFKKLKYEKLLLEKLLQCQAARHANGFWASWNMSPCLEIRVGLIWRFFGESWFFSKVCHTTCFPQFNYHSLAFECMWLWATCTYLLNS